VKNRAKAARLPSINEGHVVAAVVCDVESIALKGICSMLIALILKRSNVAAAGVLFVGTRLTSLIGFQRLALAVGAATRVAGVDRRAPREESRNCSA